MLGTEYADLYCTVYSILLCIYQVSMKRDKPEHSWSIVYEEDIVSVECLLLMLSILANYPAFGVQNNSTGQWLWQSLQLSLDRCANSCHLLPPRGNKHHEETSSYATGPIFPGAPVISVFSTNFHLSSVWHQWNKKCSTFVHILDGIIIIWWKFAQMDEEWSIWMKKGQIGWNFW
jgi:hypothetical protein